MLFSAEGGQISPEFYTTLFTMHATVMIFLVIIPILAGAFGNFLIPLMIGADDMAFPTLNMLSYWFMWPAFLCFGCSFFCYGGPQADPSKELPSWWVEAGEIGRYAYEKHRDDDDFVQPGALYRDVMDDDDRAHLVSNIVAHASDGVSEDVQRRVVAYWANVDGDLGARVADGLGMSASLGEAA